MKKTKQPCLVEPIGPFLNLTGPTGLFKENRRCGSCRQCIPEVFDAAIMHDDSETDLDGDDDDESHDSTRAVKREHRSVNHFVELVTSSKPNN
jgi:hypothetical protein